MNTIICQNCNKEIIGDTRICPSCKEEVIGAKKNSFFSILISTIVIVIVFIYFLSDEKVETKPQSKKPPKNVEIVYNNGWSGAVYQVERYLENNLKDPDSYDSIEWSIVKKYNDGTFKVRHKYRARNSFGGMNIENMIFTLDNKGNIIDQSIIK